MSMDKESGPRSGSKSSTPELNVEPEVLDLIRRLPTPYQFFRFITGSDHLHFGLFTGTPAAEDACLAQDEMATRTTARLPASVRRVLDVGCGLGGTARMLARQGKFVLGICPDQGLIEYGKAVTRLAGLTDNVYLETARFEDYPWSFADPFDAVMSLESLQYLPDLQKTMKHMAALATEKGYLLIADQVARDPEVEKMTRFHRADAIRAAAAAASWQLIDHEDVSDQATPSVSLSVSVLRDNRERLIEFFRPFQPNVVDDLEVCINLGTMEAKYYDSGAIGYEVFLFQRGDA